MTPPPAPAPAPPENPAPEAPTGPPPGRALRPALLLVAVYAVLLLWNTPRRDFWGAEAGHALVVRNMVDSSEGLGGWLRPTLFGAEPYLAKPPLTYWLAGGTDVLLEAVLGVTEPRFSYRVPAALFALLGLGLTFRLGRELFGLAVAFLAVAVQASTWLYYSSGSWLSSDLEFAVFCQLGITGFVLSARKEDSRFWPIAGWLGLAGAGLTKSIPLSFGIVFGVLALWGFFGGGVSEMRRSLRRAKRLPGPIIFLVLTAPWYTVTAAVDGVALLDQHLLQQHAERFVNATVEHRAPYFYLIALFVSFLPWTLFVPAGLYHGKDRMSRSGERLAVVWTLFVVVLFTFASSKRASFLLPLWPALALLVPAALFPKEEKFSLWEDYLGAGLFRVVPRLLKLPLVIVVATSGLWLAGTHRRMTFLDDSVRALLDDKSAVVPILLLLGAGAAGAFLVSQRVERLLKEAEVPRAAFEVACVTLFFLFAWTFLAPALNEVRSARPFLERVAELVDGAPLASYGELRPPEPTYFLERPIPHFLPLVVEAEEGSDEDARRDRLMEFLQGKTAAYLLVGEQDLRHMAHHFPSLYEPGAEADLGDPESLPTLVRTGLEGHMGGAGHAVLLSKRSP